MCFKIRCTKNIHRNKNNSHKFFLLCTILTSLIALWAFYRCHNSHIESINHIVNCQEEQSKSMDSSLSDFHKRIEDFSASKEEALKNILSNPILERLPELSSKESQNIVQYVETAITAATSEYMLSDVLNNYESIIIKERSNQLQSDTKALLELEMTKIQNEHETLGIWAALLTVVFLIFSFYSLFKTDDLVKQGQDGLDKLNEIRKDANKCVDEMKSKAEEKISTFDDNCKNALINADNQFNNELANQEEKRRRWERVMSRSLDRDIRDINLLIEAKKEDVIKLYTEAVDRVKEYETKQRQLDGSYNKLETRLKLLEQMFYSIKVEINDSIKDR